MTMDNALRLLVDEIKTLISDARAEVSREVNTAMLTTYWQVGRVIVDREQNGELKAQYGKRLLLELSKQLTLELGRGFSKSNLYNMREFYLNYPKFQMPSGKLSWSHYIELIGVSDGSARSFYENECTNAKWSVAELRRQIGTSLFERLLLSDGKGNKETVLSLARQGNEIAKPQDILKQPFVFEFLGVREEKPILEKPANKKSSPF